MYMNFLQPNAALTRILQLTVALSFLATVSSAAPRANNADTSTHLQAADTGSAIKHVIVYREQGRFCGWPANRGIWSWGNEILVGFTLGYFKDTEDTHAIDRDKPRENGILARSLDGGLTWTIERPQALSSAFLQEHASIPCPCGIDFAHPDFTMTCRSDKSRKGCSRFQVSCDRGKSWSLPYILPSFGQKRIMARTDYIVNDKNDCLVFLTASKTNGKEGRPFCARITDGGKTFDFVSWIAPEPTGYSIMPSTVRSSRTRLVSAIRRYERGEINAGWIEIYVSNDNGRTWKFLSRAADTGGRGGNPPSMIGLKDGRLALTYGYRSAPSGIRAKLSSDNGKTWGKEIILRSDGRNWDLGYTRTIRRPDGKLVTIYYYSTEKSPHQYIAATIWNPDTVQPVP